MGLIAMETKSNFKQVPQGVHLARCYRVIDLGTQIENYKDEKKAARKIMISWELFGEAEDGSPLTTDDGLPLSVSKRYTLSLNDKAILRADLQSWRGKNFTPDELKGFNVINVIDAYCMVNVIHKESGEKTYVNVVGITPLPTALRNNKPIPVNANQIFDVDNPDMDVFALFHEHLQKTIEGCAEWQSTSISPSPLTCEDAYSNIDNPF